jgi:hypothetical protein
LSQIYTCLGEQKVGVLIDHPGRRSHPPIFLVAQQEGIFTVNDTAHIRLRDAWQKC